MRVIPGRGCVCGVAGARRTGSTFGWCCCWCVLVEVVWNRLPETVRVRYTKTRMNMVVVFPE